MDKFKVVFRTALSQVLPCYPKAKVEVGHKGLTLRLKPTPDFCAHDRCVKIW